MLTKDEDLVVIGLIRNPYAVVNSFLKSQENSEKDLGWKEIEEWQFAEKKTKVELKNILVLKNGKRYIFIY